MTQGNKTEQKADETRFIEGLQKHGASIASLFVLSKAVTVAQAIATLQARVDAISASQTARIAFLDAARKQEEELASTDAFVDSLVTVVRGMYAGSPSNLADFGLTPKKVATLTVEEKSLAAEKRAATRTARHTMGKKQKAGIHGVVAPQPATPPSTPATVTPVTTGTTVAGTPTGTPTA